MKVGGGLQATHEYMFSFQECKLNPKPTFTLYLVKLLSAFQLILHFRGKYNSNNVDGLAKDPSLNQLAHLGFARSSWHSHRYICWAAFGNQRPRIPHPSVAHLPASHRLAHHPETRLDHWHVAHQHPRCAEPNVRC